MDNNDWRNEQDQNSFINQSRTGEEPYPQDAGFEGTDVQKTAEAAAQAPGQISEAAEAAQAFGQAAGAQSSAQAFGQAADAQEPVQPSESGQTGVRGADAGVSEQQSSVTYSWVNPKLQTSRNSGQSENGGSDYRWTSAPGSTQAGRDYRQAQAGFGQSGQASGQQSAEGGFQQNTQGNFRQTAQDGYGYGTQQTKAGKTRRTGSGRNRRPVSGGRKWARLVAMALVFGLVAGSVMFGVNRAGNAIFGKGQKADVTTSQSYKKVATTATTEKSGDDLNTALDDSTKTEGEKAYAGSVAEVANNAMPSLVTISTMSVQEMQSFFGGTQQYEVEGAGTGVIVGQNDSELLIATNNHVVEGATEVTVGFVDEQVVEAFIKGTDPNNDLAVVGVKLSDIPEETMNAIKIIVIGNSDDLVLGEQVVAIGNALGYGQSVTSGYVSAFDRELELSDGVGTFVSSGLIQTDAAINSGNSGGALLNMRGELVGINEAKASGSGSGASVDNVGYSIPISKAEPILEELMNLETKEKVADDEKGYLGIRCADVNEETSMRYNIPVGVYVREIASDSPAGDAGLVVGDVITKIDGRTVSAYSDLELALDYCKAGETVEVVIQRQENGMYTEKTLSVTLGESSVLERLSDSEEPERSRQMEGYGD